MSLERQMVIFWETPCILHMRSPFQSLPQGRLATLVLDGLFRSSRRGRIVAELAKTDGNPHLPLRRELEP